MHQLTAFIKKEFYHVFRDNKTLLMLFGLPIVQIVLFGFALSNEINNANIVICNSSASVDAGMLIEKIQANDIFRVKKIIGECRDIEEYFKEGDTKVVLVIPSDFAPNMIRETSSLQIISDASDPNTATTLTGYLSNIIQDDYKARFPASQVPLQITPQVRMLYNPELKAAPNFVPGVMALVLLLVCVLMTSVSIVREKEMGTMEVLLASSLHPLTIVIAKAIPYFLLSLINLSVILLMSVLLLDMPLHGSLVLLYVVSAIFILCALSLGLLISNSTQSQQVAMLISLMGMLLPTLLFTGFLFPLENMPLPLQWIANIVPSKWYYIIVKSVMLKGLGLAAIFREILILCMMTVVLLAVSIKKFKIRLA